MNTAAQLPAGDDETEDDFARPSIKRTVSAASAAPPPAAAAAVNSVFALASQAAPANEAGETRPPAAPFRGVLTQAEKEEMAVRVLRRIGALTLNQLAEQCQLGQAVTAKLLLVMCRKNLVRMAGKKGVAALYEAVANPDMLSWPSAAQAAAQAKAAAPFVPMLDTKRSRGLVDLSRGLVPKARLAPPRPASAQAPVQPPELVQPLHLHLCANGDLRMRQGLLDILLSAQDLQQLESYLAFARQP